MTAGGGSGLDDCPPILVVREQNKYRSLNNMSDTKLYSDVPWWTVLVAALVFSVVGVVAGSYFGAGAMSGVGAAAGSVSVGSLAMDTISYIPHILLLFGVLADMFTLQGVWSIPSLIGVLSIPMNYVFQYFWKGIDELAASIETTAKKPLVSQGTQTAGRKLKGGKLFENYDGCSVQGLEMLNSPYAPQTLVVTATVFSYYCFDLVRNRGWVNSLGAILGFIVIYGAEIAVISSNTSSVGCAVDGQAAQYSPFMQGLRSLFEGVMFGGVGYAITQTYAPNRLPSSAILPSTKNASDLKEGPNGTLVDENGVPYIRLPNGQAIPDPSADTSSAPAGGASSMASNIPAAPASCPGR